MIVVMRINCTQEEVSRVVDRVTGAHLRAHVSPSAERVVISVAKHAPSELRDVLELLPGVEQVIPVGKPYELASREYRRQDTVVRVGNVDVGGHSIVVMAGPCAVESEEQLLATAQAVKNAGASILRGGVFKPRTSPYEFRGMGKAGLEILKWVGEQTHMPVVTEVMAPRDVELVASYADILQVGARNMQNFTLLDGVGEIKKPVLLKRGMSCSIHEWLLAAEYILAQGNEQVILCERGIRTFETYTRNTMDISAIPVVKEVSHLPVIADPSHATGRWFLVAPLSLAAIAAGADGLLIEVHPNPAEAVSDGPQSLTFDSFRLLMTKLAAEAEVVGRGLAC